MQQLYQDAMAIVRYFGKPDLLITVTCNPESPEVRETLAANGEQPYKRPDLIARILCEKIKCILSALEDHHVVLKVLLLHGFK